MSRPPQPLAARFWPKVDKAGAGGCWIWLASLNGKGYGQINSGPRGGTMLLAHIVAYNLLVGEVPEGLELDHKCSTPSCINPDHLEPVPHAVNVQRGRSGAVNGARQRAKTHCPNGHSLADAYINPNGSRKCRQCALDRASASYAAQKAVTPCL